MNVHSNDSGRVLPSRWIQAHAGAGKTYQLVEHIVRLLVEGEVPGSILCLTYTNAAAGEMRGRLSARLRELRGLDVQALRDVLRGLLEREPDEDHIRRARHAVIDLLDAVPGVQFFTLHGFCQHLLGQFPLEAGVPTHFMLLDDRSGAAVRGRAYQALLDEAIEDGRLADAFRALQEVAKDGAVESLLMAALGMRRKWLDLFAGVDDPNVACEIISRFFAVREGEMEESFFRHYSDVWRQEAQRAVGVLAVGGVSEQKTAAIIAPWLAERSPDGWDTYSLAFLTAKGEPRKQLCTAGIARAYPDIARWLQEEQRFVLDLMALRAAFSARSLSVALTVIIHRFLGGYEAAKREMRALDYDDLLLHVRSMLADDALRPWLLYKLDQRLKHILLDEAQDTSPEQWAIVETLREELWQAQSDVSRSLLVVGDLKQSIYSFQGAVPQLFVEQQHAAEQDFARIGHAMTRMALSLSRRSAPLVLQLVDKVLEIPAIRSACLSVDAMVQHDTVHRGQPGVIACLPPVIKEATEAFDPFAPRTDYILHEDVRSRWAETLAELIRGWFDDGRMLASRGRAVEAGDILILLQTRAMALPMIQALEGKGIAVAALDRLKLSTHLAVRDHMALYEWALHPYDDYHLATVLRSPFGGLNEGELFAVAHARDGQVLWEALKERMPEAEVIARLEEWRRCILHNEPLYALQLMYADGVLRKRYSERFGEEVLEVLDALLIEAGRYAESGERSARGFVHFVSSSDADMKREQEVAGGKVRIMTVHGSKGLEAPVVILADAFHTPSLAKEQVVFVPYEGVSVPVLRKGQAKAAPQVAEAFEAREAGMYDEYYRLLYVALTRAEDELYIGGIDTHGAKSNEKLHWYRAVSEALRSMEGVVEDEHGIRLEQAPSPDFLLRRDKHTRQAHQAEALPVWIDRPAPAVDPRKRIHTPSSLVARPVRATGAHSRPDAAEQGVVYHRLLQWMEAYALVDEAELLQWVIRETPGWGKPKQRQAAGHLWALFCDPALGWLWHAPSRREVTIAGTIEVEGAPRMFAGQLDRLVILPDCRVVVDYKTSLVVPALEAIPDAYLMQMLAYKRLLEADGSGIPVKTALLYTSGPTLYMLDDILARLTLPSLDVA